MADSHEPFKEKAKEIRATIGGFNVNSILTGLVLAGMIWLISSVHTGNRELAVAISNIAVTSREVAEVRLKIVALESNIMETRVRLAEIEAIVKLKIGVSPVTR